MNLPTADEMEAIADCYRRFREWDYIHSPSKEANSDLAKIEATARKLIDALQTAGGRARGALDRWVSVAILEEEGPGELRARADEKARGMDSDSAPPRPGGELDEFNLPGRAARQELVRLATMAAAAAKIARRDLPRAPRERNNAARLAAVQLRERFLHYDLKFSATADEFGGRSQAVAALLEIARMAGDKDMTADAARKWVEFANRETIEQVKRGFPSNRD